MVSRVQAVAASLGVFVATLAGAQPQIVNVCAQLKWRRLQTNYPTTAVGTTNGGIGPFNSQYYANLVYNPIAQEHILFGGGPNGWTLRPETWSLRLNGTSFANYTGTWTLLRTGSEAAPVQNPPPRYLGSDLIWDAPRNRLVMYGGRRNSVTTTQPPWNFNDLWEWRLNATTWEWNLLNQDALLDPPIPSTSALEGDDGHVLLDGGTQSADLLLVGKSHQPAIPAIVLRTFRLDTATNTWVDAQTPGLPFATLDHAMGVTLDGYPSFFGGKTTTAGPAINPDGYVFRNSTPQTWNPEPQLFGTRSELPPSFFGKMVAFPPPLQVAVHVGGTFWNGASYQGLSPDTFVLRYHPSGGAGSISGFATGFFQNANAKLQVPMVWGDLSFDAGHCVAVAYSGNAVWIGEPFCRADYDRDGLVTSADLTQYLSDYFSSGNSYDCLDVDDGSFNGVPDTALDMNDLIYFQLIHADAMNNGCPGCP
jgi:hypothetical protein